MQLFNILATLLLFCLSLGNIGVYSIALELDRKFVETFRGLPKVTKDALEELEGERRAMSQSETLNDLGNHERLDMISAIVISHHTDKGSNKRNSRLFSKRPHQADAFRNSYNQQVRLPCDRVIEIYKIFEQSLNKFCGLNRINCDSMSEPGLFLDYYETCEQLLKFSNFERILTYSKLLTYNRRSCE